MKNFNIFLQILPVVIFLLPVYLAGQESNGFLLMDGEDTSSVERYQRRVDQLKGRALIKKLVPVTYEVKLRDSSLIEEMVIRILKPGVPEGTAATQEAMLWIKGDTVITESKKGDDITRDTIQSIAGAMVYHTNLPILPLLEQIVMRGKTLGKQKVSVPVFLLSSEGQTISADLDFSTKDSVYINLGNTKVDLSIEPDGRIISGITNSGHSIRKVQTIPDAAHSTNPPDYSAPANAPYIAEEVTIKTEAGHILAGTFTLPKNSSGPVPVVVTITGSSPQDRDNNTPFGGPYRIFAQLADSLGRNGIAVLRMDDRGVGGSTGNLQTATTEERANDILEGIKFLKGLKEVDNSKLLLVGLSEGALIAPMIAASREDLNGIVLMAGPARSGMETIKYQMEERVKMMDSLSPREKEKFMEEEMKELKEQAEDNQWLKYFLNYNPLKTAKKVDDVPVLILQGTTDKNVSPGDAKKLEDTFRAAGNEDVTLKYFEGVNHAFIKDQSGHSINYQDLESFDIAPGVMASIVEWIINYTN